MISISYDDISYDIIISYDIRKFYENKQTENREQRTENSKPEATLIPVDSRGERAKIWGVWMPFLRIVD